MFPWSLIGTALKTGAEIYKNKKRAEISNVRSKNRAC
jgi:hypothetical protein